MYSKIFSEKLRVLTLAVRADIEKAIARVLTNPTLQQYQRPYLTPYCQEHPSDKTLTLFFEILGPLNKVFFVWINDERHPHDTHKNHGDDPCLKEFSRLRASGSLETYSQNFHEGVFTVKPRANKPNFMVFEKYGVSVFSPVYHDGAIFYIMAITTRAENDEIHDHYSVFIEKLHQHFSSTKQPFEIRVNSGDHDFQKLVEDNIDPSKWKLNGASGDISWSI